MVRKFLRAQQQWKSLVLVVIEEVDRARRDQQRQRLEKCDVNINEFLIEVIKVVLDQPIQKRMAQNVV